MLGGLGVSFLPGDRSERGVQYDDHGTTPQLSFTAKKDLGASLVESLNSSRFGALDRWLSEMRKTRKFPRKYAGDDPKLGLLGWWKLAHVCPRGTMSIFEEMKEFRKVNHSQCVQPREAM